MIYLDHAAATPVNEKVLKSMTPYFTEEFFNPSAPYLPAKHVREAYEDAKNRLAHTIGAKGTDLVITSGATESINLALSNFDNILALETEHPAVLRNTRHLTEVKIKSDGRIDLNDLKAKITSETEVVSVSLVNNEIGVIQPLAEISAIVKEERLKRLENAKKSPKYALKPLYLHSDASQAPSLLDISVSRLGVDMITLNAAKIGAMKGVGALFIAHGVKLQPVIRGGGQEQGLRSGTENVPGVVGFALAAELAKSHLRSNRLKYSDYHQLFLKELQRHLPDFQPTRPKTPSNAPFCLTFKHQLPTFLPLIFPGVDAERLIYKLEKKQVYVSTGAACAASKGQKSHVLTALDLSDSEIAGSLRISLGTTNTKEQMIKAAKLIADAVKEEYARQAR